MSGYLVVALIGMTVFWIIGHWVVRQRIAALKTNLSERYHAAIAVPPEEAKTPQLVALAVDLMRKAHCTAPFHTLTPQEQRVALHAHAAEVLPGWMSRYASFWLAPRDRVLIGQLRQLRTSRPVTKAPLYNGAIKSRLQAQAAMKAADRA